MLTNLGIEVLRSCLYNEIEVINLVSVKHEHIYVIMFMIKDQNYVKIFTSFSKCCINIISITSTPTLMHFITVSNLYAFNSFWMLSFLIFT